MPLEGVGDVVTAVAADRLRTLNEQLLEVPEGFTIHPKLLTQLERRPTRSTTAASTGARPRRSPSRRCSSRGFPCG